jgi:hypothetical protein
MLFHLLPECLFTPLGPNPMLIDGIPNGLLLLYQDLHMIKELRIDPHFPDDPILDLEPLPPANVLKLFLGQPLSNLPLDLLKPLLPRLQKPIADLHQVFLAFVCRLLSLLEGVAFQRGIVVQELVQGLVEGVPVVLVQVQVSVQLHVEHGVHRVARVDEGGDPEEKARHLSEIVYDVVAPRF